MPVAPLTHHEIMALVEPFARRGYHVDLAATNRQERRIAFKAIDHSPTSDRRNVKEELHLQCGKPQIFSLQRRLTVPPAISAVVEVTGPSVSDLLERMSQVPLDRAFFTSGGAQLAESHFIETSGSVFMDIERMTLSSAAALAGGLKIRLAMPNVARYAAEIELTPLSTSISELPDDLLAVLGRNFGILDRTDKGWKAQIRMPGRQPDRSRRAEKTFRMAVTHIATTLGQPPEQFHVAHKSARWRASMRRVVPLLVCSVMLALAASISKFGIEPNSSMQLLLFNIPGLLLLTVFGLRELPRLELPRIPRPLGAHAWPLHETKSGFKHQAAE